MRILITGANGFLGHYLSEQLLDNGHHVIATGKGDCRLPFLAHSHFSYASMDFTNAGDVAAIIGQYEPELIVHAGAMSKPDLCEQQQELAYLVNVKGTIHLLNSAATQKAFFIFLSTDFIFEGDKGMYEEEDAANPINYYGLTKWQAEEEVRKYDLDWSIIRTVLVYGKPVSGRQNILSIVKGKLERGEQYSVVDDQFRTPTFVEDLAKGIVAVIERKARGVYHIAGADVLTPFEMACQTAKYLQLDDSLIHRVTAASFSEPARRPANTEFIIEKAKKKLGYHPISFEEGLKKTFS